MIKELLMSSSYWVLNKSVVKTLGIETAFLLTNLVEADKLLADDEGWFYQTIDTIEEITTLTRRKQESSIEKLIDKGILLQQNKGIPMKRYFKLNSFKVNELLMSNNIKVVQNVQTSMNELSKLECAKRTTSKELINKELNINISFDIFWKTYKGKKLLKVKCEEKWNKFSDKDRELIIKHLPFYEKEFDVKFLKHAMTYLNSKMWLDDFEEIESQPKQEVKEKRNYDPKEFETGWI